MHQGLCRLQRGRPAAEHAAGTLPAAAALSCQRTFPPPESGADAHSPALPMRMLTPTRVAYRAALPACPACLPQLVFSDEFQAPGQAFGAEAGNPRWTAERMWYWVTEDIEVYLPEQVRAAGAGAGGGGCAWHGAGACGSGGWAGRAGLGWAGLGWAGPAGSQPPELSGRGWAWLGRRSCSLLRSALIHARLAR